ncbi:MAG: hypothetical protein ABFC89_07740 [Methanospirillum sp.]
MEIESWATAVAVAAGPAVAFRLGVRFYDRRAETVLVAMAVPRKNGAAHSRKPILEEGRP